LHRDNRPSPTRMSLKRWKSGRPCATRSVLSHSVCAKFGIFMGTCIPDPVHANNGSRNDPALDASR
jgi:hypothetical protein